MCYQISWWLPGVPAYAIFSTKQTNKESTYSISWSVSPVVAWRWAGPLWLLFKAQQSQTTYIVNFMFTYKTNCSFNIINEPWTRSVSFGEIWVCRQKVTYAFMHQNLILTIIAIIINLHNSVPSVSWNTESLTSFLMICKLLTK
jgi:hypothetical protein